MCRPKVIACWGMSLAVGAISAYDCMVSVVTYDTITADECNPIASLIISTWGVEGFILAKAMGTLLSVALMLGLSRTRYGLATILPVFAMQLLLAAYLTFGEACPEGSFTFSCRRSDAFLVVEAVADLYSEYFR